MDTRNQNQNHIEKLTEKAIVWLLRFSQTKGPKLFSKMSLSDYATICRWFDSTDGSKANQKIYLADISKQLELPMGKVSRRIAKLRERGLVRWMHDGIGEEGTYIQVTEKGFHSVCEQKKVLDSFFKNVITRFGEERFAEYLRQTAELEDIISSTDE